jgi:hypothetical protein
MNTNLNIITESVFKNQLEQLIDSKGLGHILNQLVDICNEKADHCLENWQDKELYRQWSKTATKLDNYRLRLENTCPSF